MSRRPRLGFTAAAALVIATTLMQRGALAESPSLGETGATPSFASLPEGHVPGLPATKTPPGHIAAWEHVPGFVPASAPRGSVDAPYAMTYLLGDAKYVKSPMSAQSNTATGACFLDGGDSQTLRGEDVVARAAEPTGGWPTSYSPVLIEYLQRDPNSRTKSYADVHIVRRELFIPEENGRASLAIADAWFDARTHGVRLVSRTNVPLVRIYVGPNGLELYAARDGEDLQLVVRSRTLSDLDPKVAERVRTRLDNSLRMRVPDQSNPSSNCGHLRVTLRATAEQAQQANADLEAFLPPLDGHEPPAAERESEDAKAERRFMALRERPFQLSISMSQLTSDTAPVLSIGLGWSGREHNLGG